MIIRWLQQELPLEKSVDSKEARHLLGPSFDGDENHPGEFIFRHIGQPFSHIFEEAIDSRYDTGMMLHEGLSHGGCMHGKFEEGKLVSVAVMAEYDPDHTSLSWISRLWDKWEKMRASMRMASEDGKLPAILTDKKYAKEKPHWLKLWEDLDDRFAEWHIAHGPKEKHLYVKLVGTHLDFQGRGFGKQLMEEINVVADKHGFACYLEASSEKNRAFYEKRGYMVAGTEYLKDPLDEERQQVTYLMVRNPKGRPSD